MRSPWPGTIFTLSKLMSTSLRCHLRSGCGSPPTWQARRTSWPARTVWFDGPWTKYGGSESDKNGWKSEWVVVLFWKQRSNLNPVRRWWQRVPSVYHKKGTEDTNIYTKKEMGFLPYIQKCASAASAIFQFLRFHVLKVKRGFTRKVIFSNFS